MCTARCDQIFTPVKKDNQWQRGPGEWLVPPLPATFIGQTGATLQRATFEEQIGSEVFLVLLESGDSPSLLSKPELHVRAGIAHTRHGPVVFLIWYVVNDGQPAAWSEQFLNPAHKDAQALLAEAACQQYLKAATVDSISGEVLRMDEFPNVFIEDRLVEAIRRLPSLPGANFQLAVEEFSRESSVDQLLDSE
jgi:hypothetical protein